MKPVGRRSKPHRPLQQVCLTVDQLPALAVIPGQIIGVGVFLSGIVDGSGCFHTVVTFLTNRLLPRKHLAAARCYKHLGDFDSAFVLKQPTDALFLPVGAQALG